MSSKAQIYFPEGTVIVPGPHGVSLRLVASAEALTSAFGREDDRAIVLGTSEEWHKDGGAWTPTGAHFLGEITSATEAARDEAAEARDGTKAIVDGAVKEIVEAVRPVTDNIARVVAVAEAIEHVATVSEDIAAVRTVAARQAEVAVVAVRDADIAIVAAVAPEIYILAEDIADVRLAADNMTLIQAAPENAEAAKQAKEASEQAKADAQALVNAVDAAKINWRGAYAPATAYASRDAVSSGNSSWVAKVATTGNAPPALPAISNTWWDLLAAKGDAYETYGVSIYRAAGIALGGYYADRSASAGSTQSKLVAEIIAGNVGAEVDFYVEVNGAIAYGPLTVAIGTQVALSGLAIAIGAGAKVAFVVTRMTGNVTEFFAKTYGALA